MDSRTNLVLFLVFVNLSKVSLAQDQEQSSNSSLSHSSQTSGFCPVFSEDQEHTISTLCRQMRVTQTRIGTFRDRYTQTHYCMSWEETMNSNIASCGRSISDPGSPSCEVPCGNFEPSLLYIYHKLRFFAIVLEDVILDQIMGPFFQCNTSTESFMESFDGIKVDFESILCNLSQYLSTTQYDEEPQELHQEWQEVFQRVIKPECRGFNFLYDLGNSITSFLESLECSLP